MFSKKSATIISCSIWKPWTNEYNPNQDRFVYCTWDFFFFVSPCFLFLYFFVSLIRKIIKGNVFYENRNGFLICDDVKIVKISDIKNFDVKKINRNIYIRIHLKDSKKFIKEETNFLKKLNFHLANYTEKTPLIMSVDFFQEKPNEILEKLKKLVFNSELKWINFNKSLIVKYKWFLSNCVIYL